MNVHIPSPEVQDASLRARIAALEVGESYCVAKRFTADEATSELLVETHTKMHDTARAAMHRAAKATGHKYTGEQGDWRTSRGHNPVLCFLITRVE
jgi:hypothetical protein